MSFTEKTFVSDSSGTTINPSTNDVMIMLQYLISSLNNDQSLNADGSKRVTLLNAATLLGFQPPSASTNVSIWGFVADQSKIAETLTVINNFK